MPDAHDNQQPPQRRIARTDYKRRGALFGREQDKRILLDYKSTRRDYPLIEIAHQLGMNYKRVCKLWSEIEEENRRRYEGSRDLYAQEEIRNLDRLIDSLSAAWARSQEDKTVETKGVNDGKAHASVQKIKQHGDGSIMAQILKAIDMRCKLLGTYAPEKHEHAHEFGKQAVQAFTKICMIARRFIDPARWEEWKAEALKVRAAFADPPARVRSTARQEAN